MKLRSSNLIFSVGPNHSPQEVTLWKTFEKIMREKKLPSVGQTVRSKKHRTLWRVMEKKEVWQNIDPDPKSGETRMVPAIYLSYWKVQEGAMPGVGR